MKARTPLTKVQRQRLVTLLGEIGADEVERVLGIPPRYDEPDHAPPAGDLAPNGADAEPDRAHDEVRAAPNGATPVRILGIPPRFEEPITLRQQRLLVIEPERLRNILWLISQARHEIDPAEGGVPLTNEERRLVLEEVRRLIEPHLAPRKLHTVERDPAEPPRRR